MKTFTITFHHGTNYGALLQTYALQQTILSLGFENTVFEYPYGSRFYDKIDLRRPRAAASSAYYNYNKLLHKKAVVKREESFRAFHRDRLQLSREFKTMDELRRENIGADVLITGSDQVWRFSGNPEFVPARFLDFGSDSARRVSYAASVEQLNYTEEQKELVRNWLSRFKAVSLREESARAYISEITGREAVRVLDPVLLLTPKDWAKIAEPPRVKRPYILCYQVQSNHEMQRTVSAVKQMTGCSSVAVLPYSIKFIKTDEAYFDVSPEEFIGLYQNAAAVVSGSFHGTALGYLFGKPTYAVTRAQGSSRILDLAELFGLKDFCIGAGSAVPDPEAFDKIRLADRLNREREKSLTFLKNALTD